MLNNQLARLCICLAEHVEALMKDLTGFLIYSKRNPHKSIRAQRRAPAALHCSAAGRLTLTTNR